MKSSTPETQLSNLPFVVVLGNKDYKDGIS